MSLAHSFGIAAAMPNARQTVDRFHVMQLLAVATDRVRRRERGESAEKRAEASGDNRPKSRSATANLASLEFARTPARDCWIAPSR